MTLTIISLYFAIVLGIGWASHRLFKGTGEDYFLATRSIGPFLLLASLFGTHMTAFALLGSSGEAYRRGVGVFALMASSSAFVAPLIFFFLGTRMWAVGKRHSFMTQSQFFRERWESDLVGILTFILLVILLIPYILIGVMGGGITLNQISQGMLPEWVGSLLVCTVVLVYVTYSGLRGTAWANAFQTIVFMVLGALTFIVVVNSMGGLGEAMGRLQTEHPEMLMLGGQISFAKLLSYTLIPLSAGMFPHIFMHWLAARRASTFRRSIVLYPVCVAVVWIPTVLLGIFGRLEFPGLEGPAANAVLVQLIDKHAPTALAGLLAAGVFAAIMSSLDSQILSLGTMFTQDIVRHVAFRDRMRERHQVLAGRLFVVGILSAIFILSRFTARSIFSLGVWSFSGFAALLPVLIAALYWKRSTWVGALCSIVTVAVLWLYFFLDASGNPDYSLGDSGLMPVVPMVAASSLMMWLGSILSAPPAPQTVARFFPE